MSHMLVLFVIELLVFSVNSLDRIIGGKQVDIKDFPYQVGVRHNGRFICGGVIISATYALTAAHCMKSQGAYSITAGTNYINKGGKDIYIKQAIIHPENYNHPYDYDIAILEFLRPLEFTEKIQPIQLPQQDEPLMPGMLGVVSGWGAKSNYIPSVSTQLKAVEVPVVNDLSCHESYYWVDFSPRVFCAGFREGGRDSCQGDSGGPFVIDNILYGLVSFGLNCATPGYPGVYTRVASYREYIRINTGF